MGIVKQTGQKSSRKSLKASASLLGLAAGAVGWSGLAQAASEETGSQMMLLPEHYELLENGVVVFKLESGENLSLTADQYLILEDGLLLITDELAQASIYNLPVMGSVRAQLLSDLEQVATIDGTVAEATLAKTLSITEGQAPRLSEQVELQSYEVAQASDVGADEDDGHSLLLPLGLSGGAFNMVLLGLLMPEAQPAVGQDTEGSAPGNPNSPPELDFSNFPNSTVNSGLMLTGLYPAPGLDLSQSTSDLDSDDVHSYRVTNVSVTDSQSDDPAGVNYDMFTFLADSTTTRMFISPDAFWDAFSSEDQLTGDSWDVTVEVSDGIDTATDVLTVNWLFLDVI